MILIPANFKIFVHLIRHKMIKSTTRIIKPIFHTWRFAKFTTRDVSSKIWILKKNGIKKTLHINR